MTTKIHALTDARGLPINFILTPGQAHDLLGAADLLTDLGEGDVLLGDKAYDADWLRRQIEAQGAAPNIPDKSNRKEKHCFSKALYKERNRVERFFNRIGAAVYVTSWPGAPARARSAASLIAAPPSSGSKRLLDES